MRFAEMTQDVQISKPTPRKIDLGLTPGRRKANQIFKMALDNLEEGGQPDARRLDVDLGLVYSLGPKFPSMKLDTPELDSFVRTLMDFLQKRIQKRTILVNDLCARREWFGCTAYTLSLHLLYIYICYISHREQFPDAAA